MIINILEYLENAQDKYASKILYKDAVTKVTFREALSKARKWGAVISKYTDTRKPIIVISDKSVKTPLMYFAVLYSGCYYVPIDPELPQYRINLILDTVGAKLLVADKNYMNIIRSISFSGKVLFTDELDNEYADDNKLIFIRQQTMDVDPAYVIFTSGSTGRPKGVIESHRQLIDYIETFSDTFNIHDDEIFGNQSPLDYIAAIRDIYIPLKTGATSIFIPKNYFSAPAQLFDYINENKITTLCWVVGALTLCSELGTFEESTLNSVKKVFFTGAVMPCKHLKVWQMNLPEALFVNHYGPTEITASCTYHILDHIVDDEETVPIGRPFRNTNIILLKEDDSEANNGEVGEICVQGTSIALGYYRDQEKTDEVFMHNPLNKIYPEIIYRTGDLGRVNECGELEFLGRKDNQIKHMGHRIELSEIEKIASNMKGLNRVISLYHKEKQQIWLFYTGSELENKDLAYYLRSRLPNFMIPRKFVKLEEMPVVFNGKIDVQKLKKMMR